jgi:hypothetical protein
MKASVLVSQLLAERVGFDDKKVGVELEFLLRYDLRLGADVGAYRGGLSNSLIDLLTSSGFILKRDRSVVLRPGNSLERFYADAEIASSAGGEPWSDLAPKLERVLAWLKHEDRVMFLRGSPNTIRLASKPVPENHKVLTLPRARTTSNYSAGLHLHFDVDDWFDSPAHVDAFLRYWNGFQGDVPKYLPVGRYAKSERGDRANFYASVDYPIVVPYDDELGVNPSLANMSPDRTDPMWNRMVSAVDYLKKSGGARYSALNVQKVRERGDIEFRFAHATLNFDTISGWLRLLAEFINFSKDYSHVKQTAIGGIPQRSVPDVRSRFTGYLQREAPDSATFADRAQAVARKSKDPLTVQAARPAPRATQRLFKLRKPKSVLDPSYAEWYGVNHGDDRELQNRLWFTNEPPTSAEVEALMATPPIRRRSMRHNLPARYQTLVNALSPAQRAQFERENEEYEASLI